MFKLFSKLFDSNEKQINKISPLIKQINDLEGYTEGLSDDELRGKTEQFRERLGVKLSEIDPNSDYDIASQKAELMELLPEAFATIREAAKRYTNHRHFDVQLMAGYFLATNKITELFTGEGKTNAANLAMYLYALTGRGAHLVTVNDYLARRDGEWNGHILSRLGMSVGVLNNGVQYRFITDEEAIKTKGAEAEEAIKERDRLAKEAGRLKLDLMTGVNLVQCSKKEVYECDLVYGTNNEFGFDYLRDNMTARLGDRVQKRLHYAIVDEADSILIDEARTPLIISQSAQQSNDLYKQFAKIVRQLDVERDYTVDEKANSVALNDDGISRVEKLLAVENIYENAQFAYHLDNALKAKELYKLDDEYIVREGEIVIVDEFTGRALPGRRYSEGLHQAIEAKEGVEVKRESRTLATITLQNYFRLYDYLAGMTGTALTEAEEFANIYKMDVVVIPTNRPVVRKDENDVVYRTQMGKFRAIVQDIKEHYEIGQPVLVGTTSVEKSEIISQMLEKDGIPHQVLNAKQHEKEARIVQLAGQKKQVTIATNMAGRGTDIGLGEGVKELGGLYIIGSERHESRRIDNQLRGRSGRQGDPGKSRFFVSFEDELMRLFGGDRMQTVMGRVGMDDDMPVSIGILGRTIENAQKRVEAHNFDIRKRLVEYDDILNQQRGIVYGLRKQIQMITESIPKEYLVGSQKLSDKLLETVDFGAIFEDIDQFALKDRESWSVDQLEKIGWKLNPVKLWVLKRVVGHVRTLVAVQLSDDMKIDNAEERRTVAQIRALITDELTESAAKLLGHQNSAEFFKKFDGLTKSVDQEIELLKLVVVAFLQHIEQIGGRNMVEISKVLTLQAIDNLWMEHLDMMADLREGIGMRSIAQKDPLVEYKNEGFMLFEKMLAGIDTAVVNRFYKVRIAREEDLEQTDSEAVHAEAPTIQNRNTGSAKPAVGTGRDTRPGVVSKQSMVVNEFKDIGRNDLCPCGSGKKYKNCGLKDTREHIDNMRKR